MKTAMTDYVNLRECHSYHQGKHAQTTPTRTTQEGRQPTKHPDILEVKDIQGCLQLCEDSAFLVSATTSNYVQAV